VRALIRRSLPIVEAVDSGPGTELGSGAGASTNSGMGSGGERPLQVADLRMDTLARRAWHGEAELRLSKTEFDLLELLVRNEGIVLDHATIYDRIWGYAFSPDSKNLAVYISYLRRKLDAAGAGPLIHTIRGVGYSVRTS
jgi:two-component system response regulator MprA